MKWTVDRPTEEGFFLRQNPGSMSQYYTRHVVITVDGDLYTSFGPSGKLTKLTDIYLGMLWYGPIPFLEKELRITAMQTLTGSTRKQVLRSLKMEEGSD